MEWSVAASKGTMPDEQQQQQQPQTSHVLEAWLEQRKRHQLNQTDHRSPQCFIFDEYKLPKYRVFVTYSPTDLWSWTVPEFNCNHRSTGCDCEIHIPADPLLKLYQTCAQCHMKQIQVIYDGARWAACWFSLFYFWRTTIPYGNDTSWWLDRRKTMRCVPSSHKIFITTMLDHIRMNQNLLPWPC